ncbi:recombinase family protein [Vibrio sp. FNV 38]|nr:recombinase family protein [Vibrio sp. FNV 38]
MVQPMIYPYQRISTMGQAKGTGLEQQLNQKVLDTLSTEHDLPICEAMVDLGKSAYHGEHLNHELGAFVQGVKDGLISSGSIIVVYSLDRLSRLKLGYAKQIYLDLTNNGVHIFSVIDNHLYRAHSVADEIVSSIVFERSHNESNTKSQRTRGSALALIDRHLKGDRAPDGNPFAVRSVGRFPWFIDSSGGTIKPHAYFFPVAQWLVQQSLNGVGTTRLVNALNEECTAPNGKQWSRSTVRRFTSNKALLGIAVFNIDNVTYELPDYYPPLTTEDEFYRIRAMKSSATHSRTSKNSPTILSGLQVLKCRSCGGGMNYFVTGTRHAYRCINGMNNKARCKGMSCSAEPVHEAVKRSLTWMSVQPPPTHSDKVTPLSMKLSEAKGKLNQMEADYMQSPSSIMAKMLAQMETEVSSLSVSLEEAKMNQASTFEIFEEPETTGEYRDVILRSVDTVQLYKLGRDKILVSVYYKSNIHKHYYMVKGKIVHEGRFYHAPQEEIDLQDRLTFLLWVESGKLNQWLEHGDTLDTLPDHWDH